MASRLSNVNMEGLISINGIDLWATYGVFLSEERAGDRKNFSELLSPSSVKPHKAVSYREEDGERLPDTLVPRLEARERTLRFSLLADGRATFLERHRAFLTLLRSGDGKGWLTLEVPELGHTFRLYYLSGGDYEQVTPLEDDIVVASFTIKFREPQPLY